MKYLARPWLLSLILCAPVTPVAQDREDRLSTRHRTWLEEEVPYIITDRERDVFLSLETEEQRDLFVEAFWRQRDPFPATMENEFRTEHYRRIEYANEHFSREAPTEGWRTDRGRFYIILGEPLSIQRYDGLGQVVPSELWIYEGDPDLGLPPRFNLLFFRDFTVGPYELYDPVSDGPARLLRVGSSSLIADPYQALEEIELVSADLALAAVTVDLTDSNVGVLSSRAGADATSGYYRPLSTSIGITMANIVDSPRKLVDTSHLDGYLRYGDRVSSEYSFNYVPNRFYVATLPGPGRTPFVHFALEIDPRYFSVEADEEGRYHTTLDIRVEARDSAGHSITSANTVPITLSASELERAASLPFAYLDDFPVALPGSYEVSVTLRNRLTKQFTVAEADVQVPRFGAATGVASLVAAHGEERIDDAGPETHLTFQIGALRIHPAVGGVFAIGDTVHAFAIVTDATAEHRVRFAVLDGDEALANEEVPVNGRGPALVGGKLSLVGTVGGNYRLRARLVDRDGEIVGEATEPIVVSPRSRVPRAGIVYREGFYAEVPGLLPLVLGEQLLMMGRAEEAIEKLQEAVTIDNPRLPMAKWKLARALLVTRQVDRALAILRPLEERHGDEYDVVEGLGLAYFFKERYEAALPHLERAMAIRAPGVTVLNALASCYQAVERLGDARTLFERSLALDPNQPAVTDWLESHR